MYRWEGLSLNLSTSLGNIRLHDNEDSIQVENTVDWVSEEYGV